MTRNITVALLAALALNASAAIPTYQPARQLDLPAGSFHPVLSPDAQRLLFSTMDHTGLQCLDMASGQISTIDNSIAAGFQPIFSPDGSRVIYQTSKQIDKLIHTDVRSYDFARACSSEISPMGRNNVELKSLQSDTYAVSAFDKINITINGNTSYISPVEGSQSYLWASLSPDGTKVLFTEAFKGAFICNLDGSDLRNISRKGIYPCWLDNNTIATVEQTDDGYFITSSHILISDLATGYTAVLTSEEVLVDEITAANNKTIVYSTLDGEVYILTPNN